MIFLRKDISPLFSETINQPLYSLGFLYFLHRTKDNMSIVDKLPTKEPIYYVVNKFEHFIKGYDDDLNSLTLKYFKMKKSDPKILSRAFYKMWEMLFLFDLADQSNLTYAALAEGPGSFLQAVLMYRKLEYTSGSVSKDKYFGVTIHPEDGKFINMAKQFLGYYEKNHPDLIKIHKTYKLEKANKYKSRDNGDITNVKTIGLFRKDIKKSKKYADLVTADGGFDWVDENYQEQEGYALILGEIVAALNVQAKGGSFVLKIFDSYTLVTLKMIYILKQVYNKVYIFKPYFSRESNAEKYVICKDFKFDQKSSQLKEIKSTLEGLLEQMNTDMYLNDFYPDFQLSQEYINLFKNVNLSIANNQQIVINKMITYIKGSNYFGELYHNYKDEQIKATKWWTSQFYPNSKDEFKKNQSKMKKFIDSVNQENIEKTNKMLKQFI